MAPEQLGLTEPPTELVLWPINATPIAVFHRIKTQWRTGPGGPVGLDYQVLPMVLQLLDVPQPDHRDTFEALRICEDEALTWFAEQRKD